MAQLPIKLASDTIDKSDIDALCAWLQQDPTPQLTKSKLTVEYEEKYAANVGSKYAVFVNSGSSANLLAISTLISDGGLKNKKVVIPGIAWITTISPIIQLGLEPILCDVNLSDLSVELNNLEDIFKKEKPAGLFLVSVLGMVPDMDAISGLCAKYGVTLLLDGCESQGSTFNARRIENYALMATCSSYYGHITSVAPKTPIPFIDENGTYKIYPISEIFDKYQKTPEKIKVISFNNENNKTLFAKPSAIIKHKIDLEKKIFRITLRNNRTVEITEDHSVFSVCDSSLKITAKTGIEIKKGDYIVVPKRIPTPPDIIETLDFYSFCKKDEDKFFVINYDKDNLKNAPRGTCRSPHRRQIDNYKARGVLPLKYLTKKTESLRIAYKRTPNNKYLPLYVPVTIELSRLIGYFLAEGCYSEAGLALVFHKDEHEYINDVCDIVEKTFGLETSLSNKGNVIILLISSATIQYFFESFLGIKRGAKNKRIPDMVWKFNDECKLAFLYAYFCGDGTFYKNRLSVASISYDLINDVSYMLSMFGVRGSIVQTNKEKTFRINNNKNLSHSKGVRSFRMYNVELTKDGKILKVDKNCYHSSLAEKETFEVPYYSEKLKKTGKKKFVELLKQKEYLSNSIGAQKLKYGDLTLLQVKSIEEIVPDYEYVYDFSVPIHENFIGGQQPICLHNSTVEGGMITTDDESYFNILKMKRSHGWDRDISEEKRRELRKIQGTTKFNQLYRFHTDGFNFRNNEIGAFLGLRQLDKLGSFIEKRHRNFLLYNSLIENDYWKPVERENCVTSNLGYPLISPKLDEIVEALRGNNVEVRPLISGNIGLHPFYEKLFGKKDLPFANKADEYGCYLPNHQSLTEEEIKFVCDIVNRIINKTNT